MTDYFTSPGLSHSMMKDLAVSPYRFWFLNLNPDRLKIEPTKEMQFGSALHCGVFETAKFDSLYCQRFEAPEGCLDTMDDLRKWLIDNGIKPNGKRKQELIDQVIGIAKSIGVEVPILDVLERDYASIHNGKTMFKADDWQRIADCATALHREPEVMRILNDPNGKPEHIMTAVDPDTGVTLRVKLDWGTSWCTADLKTFSQQRGRSIDKCVSDAIWWEGYYRQAWLYSYVRHLNGEGALPFVNIFVESEPPHEIRIRTLSRYDEYGEPNLYWQHARSEVKGLIKLYADCMNKFGTDKPWRVDRDMEPLRDEELPQLAWTQGVGEVPRREYPATHVTQISSDRYFIPESSGMKPAIVLPQDKLPPKEITMPDQITLDAVRKWMDEQSTEIAAAYLSVFASDIDRRPLPNPLATPKKKERKPRTKKADKAVNDKAGINKLGSDKSSSDKDSPLTAGHVAG